MERMVHSVPLPPAGVPHGDQSPLTGQKAASVGDEPTVPTHDNVTTLSGANSGITHADLRAWVDVHSNPAQPTPTPHMRPKHPLSLDEQAKVLAALALALSFDGNQKVSQLSSESDW
jgi:hypothetical protein